VLTDLCLALYNTRAILSIECGSEILSPYKKEKKRMPSIEIKIFRRTAWYTLFHDKINEEILEEVKVEPVDEILRRYKSDCKKNEQQEGDKNNDELQIKRTKKPRKIFEENLR